MGILVSVNNILYLHLMSHMLILNTFLLLHHLIGVKNIIMHSVRLLNSKERVKQKGSFEYLHRMTYEHVDRDTKIRSLTASSHHTYETMIIIIKNQNKVCQLIFPS